MIEKFKIDCILNDYINSPVSKEFLDSVKDRLESLCPLEDAHNKKCKRAFFICLFSFVFSISVVSINSISWGFESLLMKWYLLSHVFVFVIIGYVWTGDLIIPSEKELSVKVDGAEYLRIPAIRGGMLDQLSPCKIEGQVHHVDAASRLLENIAKQNREPVMFESNLIKGIVFKEALSIEATPV